jgi:predicted ATPase/class 3 adenylate cyclase/Tfp pilus assembly protein PilF
MSVDAAAVHYILFTDIGRSSYLWENFPQHYPAALEAHNHLTEDAVARCGGVVMKNMGDGYIALFPTADSALQAAVELQLRLAGTGGSPPIAPFPDGSEIQVRSIVHCGPLQRLSAGLGWFGPPLNRSARICGVCHPGQLLISGPISSTLSGPPDGCTLDDLGPCRLRDMGEPEQLFQVTHGGFGKRQFPPLVTLDSRPNNLASQPNAFIGREHELRTLARMLGSDTRLLTLHAPGGYGKSRLATQLCANVLGRFEQGVFEVLLAPLRDHERIPEAIASATGYQFSGSREPAQQVLDYLRSKEMLLYFDNFEHLMDGADFIGEILKAAPKVRILTTSREPLRLSAERVFRLEPLPTGAGSASVELFADRASLVQHDFALDEQSSAWVQQICEKLEGIPLAIELFAAWSDDFTLEEMHSQLDQQLEQTARMRDVPVRQRSVRASCDWSWNLLSEHDRETLMRLAPFRGGFWLQAGQAVLQADDRGARTLLGRLLDKSWLYTRQLDANTRYSIRDAAAWEYAWGKLQETGTGDPATESQAADSSFFERAVWAHAGYFAEVTANQGKRLEGDGTPGGQIEALTALKHDLANIYEALEAGQSRQALELLVPIGRHLSRFLSMVGDSLALRTRYSALLELAQKLGSKQLELSARLGLGRALTRLGGHDEAARINPAALSLAAELGDPRGEAMALVNGGILDYMQGRIAESREKYEQALKIQREIADRCGEAASLHNLGLVAASQGDYLAARDLYRESLQIKREIGDSYGEASSLNSLAGVECQQGEYASGRELLTRALDLFRELGDRSGEANALVQSGNVECRQGMFADAGRLFSKALVIKREIGDRNGEAWVLSSLGTVEYCLGNNELAHDYLAKAAALLHDLGNRFGEGRVLSTLAHVLSAQGEFARACDLYRASLTIESEIGDRLGMAIACSASAAALAGLGLYREGALALHGGLAQVAALNHSFGPDDRQAIAVAEQALDTAVAEGLINHGDLEADKLTAGKLSLEDLAAWTIQALQATPARA